MYVDGPMKFCGIEGVDAALCYGVQRVGVVFEESEGGAVVGVIDWAGVLLELGL